MTREDWAAQPDDDTRFQQEHADLLDNHMRAYALQCLKSGDDGPDQHPLWLRQVFCSSRSVSTKLIADAAVH
jgi:hypothetical protein